VPDVLKPARGRLEVVGDAETLARRGAAWLLEAVTGVERAAVAISGGTTPRRLFELLAGEPLLSRFPWRSVDWFWVDERFVPPDDPASNQRMAREAFLSRAPVPAGNVHLVPTVGLAPAEAAQRYERELKAFYEAGRLDPARPLFTAVLLGLGEDGHTASLVPGHPAVAERQRWVAAVLGARPEPRITLTIPALASSRSTAVLVSGAGKAGALRRALAGDPGLPTSAIDAAGAWLWLADEAAAGQVRSGG
jgi:6-phosphogluconolactonase